MAAVVVDQALAFLGTTATYQGRPLSPSEEDPGWHEFILQRASGPTRGRSRGEPLHQRDRQQDGGFSRLL